MKIFQLTLALLFAALFTSTFAVAGEDAETVIEKRVKIALAGEGDPELLTIEAEDLEEGETRQYFTESGKEVLLTRTADGLEVEVDGEQIDVGLGEGHLHSFAGDGEAKIIVRRLHGDEGEVHEAHSFAFHHGEGDFEWAEGDVEGARIIHLSGHSNALDRLREAGVLDAVDEATRQKILDALGHDSAKVHQRKIVIHREGEEDGDD